MKCPKCGYISFEYLDDCNKCEKDLTRHKKIFNISEEKHSFINVLQYIELENTPNKDFEEAVSGTAEHPTEETSALDAEVSFESEPERDTLPELRTATVTSDISDEPAMEEIQLEEVSITLDDIDTSEEKIEPTEKQPDMTEALKTKEVSADNVESDSLQIEEIDLSEAPDEEISLAEISESSVSVDKPAELEDVEILLDSKDSDAEPSETELKEQEPESIGPESIGDEEKSGEIEFSFDGMEPVESVPEQDLANPAEETESQDLPGEPFDVEVTIDEVLDETEAASGESTEKPAVESEIDAQMGEKELLKAGQEKQAGDTGLDFSLDQVASGPEKTAERPEQMPADDDALELSLDEFDNFSIDTEDFDLTGDVPLEKETRETGAPDSPKQNKKESKRKGDDKKPADNMLDIDLDDLYPDS